MRQHPIGRMGKPYGLQLLISCGTPTPMWPRPMPANQQDGALPVVEYIAGPDNIWADETSPITAKINLRPESILPSLSCVHPIADPQFLTHFNSKFPYLATHLNWITICLLLATTCSAISPPIHTGSHRLLSHRTIAWLSLTPQVGAIPFALATHSALLPVVSIVVQPDLSVATPLCKATLPDSSFVSYSLPQLLHHLRLLRTPAMFDFTSLNPVLNWLLIITPGLQASTAAVLTPPFRTSCHLNTPVINVTWLPHTRVVPLVSCLL